MASLANVSNKTGELSNLYREYHLGFEALRKEVTQPLSETERGVLDEAAREAVVLVFERLKNQLAAIPAAFVPSLPDPQADVSTLFRRVSWVRGKLGKAASGQGAVYYTGRAPQFVEQITRINGQLCHLKDLHKQIMPLKSALSLEEQRSVLGVMERAATPAAIEELRNQIKWLEAAEDQAFKKLEEEDPCGLDDIAQLSRSRNAAEDKLRELESIHSNLAFIEEKG